MQRLQEYLRKGFKGGATLTPFEIFETYRTPERQDEVYKAKNSQVRAWGSAHQLGLAVDFAVRHGTVWSWDDHADWNYLKQAAIFHGLDIPIAWDKGHVQHRDWSLIRTRMRS